MMSVMATALAVFLSVADPQQHWLASWVASPHGPYPSGNAVAQPVLDDVLSTKAGARDQTFRMVVKPDRWSSTMRIRFTNMFGKQPVIIDGAYAGIHAGAGSIVQGTNVALRFEGGKASLTLAPGQMQYSDPVRIAAVPAFGTSTKLAISFHMDGVSGPMTWHAKAIATSYMSGPGSGSFGKEETADSFPYSTTSWFFIDAVEIDAGPARPCPVPVIVAFGDSITDGTGSTINGDDRYPDFLSQRLAGKAIVLNAGIGGNRVVTDSPSGGPSALHRLDRDVLSLPGVKTVIWLEGINDLGSRSSSVEDIIAGFRQGASRLREKGIRVIAATLTSALGTTPTHGTPEIDAKRKEINAFLRNHDGVFDGVVDFDAATADPVTGRLKVEYWPSSSIGGPGDGLHPNRAGYQAMAKAIDLNLLLAGTQPCSPAPAKSSSGRK